MTRGPGVELESFQGKRVLVLGLGRFAGGVETVRFLRAEGAEVVVSDLAPRDTLADSARDAEALGAALRFGAQDARLLADRDAVIANPAVPFDHPVVEAARERGIPVTTEINIVLARSRAPVYAVTGTKGKSTTAALLANMLRAAGRTVHLGGNIGRPLVARLDSIGAGDRVVLELSSFQLWWTRAIERSPNLTLVTNLLSDHLDRHGTQAAYAEAKRAALDYQGPDDIAVLPADDPAIRAAGWIAAGRARRVLYGVGGTYRFEGGCIHGVEGLSSGVALTGMPLLGAHNRRNALAAAAAVLATQEDAAPAVAAGARETRPLPHRLEPVAEVQGVLYVDDSNATHPHSTRAALDAIDRPVVLVAGGKDKGLDPAPLFDAIRGRAKAVVAIGTSAAHIVEGLGADLPVKAAGNIEEAVSWAAAQAQPGEVVLLSPGYSSLDEFTSFAERGERFQAAVRSLEAAP